jgi:hypothetical protein
MTPFAEDALELVPDLAEFLGQARFVDLNDRTEEVQKAVHRIGEAFDLDNATRLEDGHYWIECSGHDRRYRIAFLCHVEGIEVIAKVMYQEPGGNIAAMRGVAWLVFSKCRAVIAAVPVDGQCDMTVVSPLLLAACIHTMKQAVTA